MKGINFVNEEQLRQRQKDNVRAVLKDCGLTREDVIRITARVQFEGELESQFREPPR